MRSINIARIDYRRFIHSFDSLEQRIGILPIFALAERLPDDHKKKRYEYLLKEYMGFAISTIGLLSRKLDSSAWQQEIPEESSKEIAEVFSSLFSFIGKIGKQVFSGKNEDFLQFYCREWEVIYNVLVAPIWDKIKTSKKRAGRNRQILSVKDYFLKYEDTIPLANLLSYLNTDLQNAITHLNYYIDEAKNSVIYFDVRKDAVEVNTISLEDLETYVGNLIIARMILFTIIGHRLSKQFNINWDDIEQRLENDPSDISEEEG